MPTPAATTMAEPTSASGSFCEIFSDGMKLIGGPPKTTTQPRGPGIPV